jgi:hypothetical protein
MSDSDSDPQIREREKKRQFTFRLHHLSPDLNVFFHPLLLSRSSASFLLPFLVHSFVHPMWLEWKQGVGVIPVPPTTLSSHHHL